jgi:hypothetical protein
MQEKCLDIQENLPLYFHPEKSVLIKKTKQQLIRVEGENKMPTCGECSLLVKTNAGIYVCAGKQNLCFSETLTPDTDAKSCIRFSKKVPKKAD